MWSPGHNVSAMDPEVTVISVLLAATAPSVRKGSSTAATRTVERE
jgi:hypothetical protein